MTIFKNLGFGMVLAAGVATGVAAHQGTAQQTPPPKSPQMKTASQTAKHGAVTLTGCLARGVANSTTSSSVVPPGSPPPPPMYKLTRIDANALNAAMSEAAEREMGEQTAAITEVGLRADSKMNLAEHVDQKVEITGKFLAGKPVTKNATTTARGAVPTTGGIPEVPSFQVTNVRMVAPSCQ